MLAQRTNTIRTTILTDANQQSKRSLSLTVERDAPPSRSRSIARLARRDVDRLLSLAEFLPVSDGLIIREVVGSGRPVAYVARLIGQSRHRVRTRISRLIARTNDPAFLYVLSRRVRFDAPQAGGPGAWRTGPRVGGRVDQPARCAWPEEWPEPLRATAQLCVLDGLSCRAAAARTGTSYHVFRRHLSTLRELGHVWRSSWRED